MSIKEYLSSRDKCSELNEEPFKVLISELRESEPTKEEVLGAMESFLKELGKTYTKGFEDCVAELDKIDANFLSRKKPPHLK